MKVKFIYSCAGGSYIEIGEVLDVDYKDSIPFLYYVKFIDYHNEEELRVLKPEDIIAWYSEETGWIGI